MTFLLINLITIAIPLALSFNKKVRFHQYWRFLWPGILIMMAVFIPWDIWFTTSGYWGFNQEHLIGIKILNLPLEAWLFFITLPYAGLFIYECVRAYMPLGPFITIARPMAIVLMAVFIIIAAMNLNHMYTVAACTLGVVLLQLALVTKSPNLHWFQFAYLVFLIPFLLINGWLTGAFTDTPVVWHNDTATMAIRVFNIPIEDYIYNLDMLLMVFLVYDRLEARKTIAQLKT